MPVDTASIMQWIVAQGGLAGFAIWMLVRSWEDKATIIQQHVVAAERYAQALHEVTVLLLATLEKNTERLTLTDGKIDGFATALALTGQRQEDWIHERRIATTGGNNEPTQ